MTFVVVGAFGVIATVSSAALWAESVEFTYVSRVAHLAVMLIACVMVSTLLALHARIVLP